MHREFMVNVTTRDMYGNDCQCLAENQPIVEFYSLNTHIPMTEFELLL